MSSRRGPQGEEDEEAPEASRPSRTELTRAASAVNKLGVALTRLSDPELDRLELSERLREEVERSRTLKPRARGRQNRLIGQLLRAEDHEAIAERLEALSTDRRAGLHHERVTDRWVDRLIEEGDPAIDALLADFPDADRQRLRRLVRNARKKPGETAARRARRELGRVVRELRA
ncbi:MAG: ribosome biogenesis factor YjgA [Myxococcota bacterium]